MTVADDMLLKQQTKRQSFSIESLAVSSRVEQERNTDSPFLTYLAETNAPVTQGNPVDYNSNVAVNWSEYPGYDDDHDEKPLVIDETNNEIRNVKPVQLTGTFKENVPVTVIDYATSTPKLPPPKRRRLESTSTPPSSSDDSAADDKMITDDSSVLSIDFPLTEKVSPSSTTNSSAASGKQ